ncbi:hypothetical protein FQA39_LY05217 [Lamprigera yunnana]|nr:hypothetical protein FQA39_LY05217 [Lamprigera yunnana]
MLPILLLFMLQGLMCAPQPGPTNEEVAQNWFNLIDPYESVCVSASNADIADVKQLWATFIYPDNIASLKCYMKCIYEEAGFVDGQWNVLKDKYVKLVIGMTNEKFDTCEAETRTIEDICEKLYNFDKCVARVLGL